MPADRDEEVRTLYMSGVKLSRIEDQLGICNRSIYLALRRLGIQPDRNKRKPWYGKKDPEIEKLFLKGRTIKEICRELGISSTRSVHYRLTRHILTCRTFRVKFRSKFNGKWKRSVRSYNAIGQLRRAYRKYLTSVDSRKDIGFEEKKGIWQPSKNSA
jgi:hypothetical protein